MTYEKPLIEIYTERSHLVSNKAQTVDVLIRVTPPANDQGDTKRPKLNLSLVLDRSGSMQGQKMREAKEAAKYCVDQLLSTDRIGCIIFDDNIEELIPSQNVQNKDMLKRAINSVQTDGSTALHEAWVRGGLQVSEHLDPDAINRVLLITDGEANVGETNADRIVTQTRRLAENGVSTSTIGIGRDFNEDLLMPMAEAGHGNAWHVQEPEDMVGIFETELNGLVSQFGHRVTMGIITGTGVSVADVLNDFEIDDSFRYILPNLEAGLPLNIVVRLRVPASEKGESGELAAFDFSYISRQSKIAETVEASLVGHFDDENVVSTLPENLEVATAVLLLMNARARREAMDFMDAGAYSFAMETFDYVSGDTEVAYSRMPSPALAQELEDLNQMRESMQDRDNDALSRKRMAYRRESIRKSK